jgi:hypothetical protein
MCSDLCIEVLATYSLVWRISDIVVQRYSDIVPQAAPCSVIKTTVILILAVLHRSPYEQ